MDHVPLPTSFSGQVRRVPYYCKQEYDRLDFLTYPSRVGWKPQEVHIMRTWEQIGKPGSRTIEDAHALLQEWLFFGLLDVAFHDTADFCDFTDTISDAKYVNTRQLIPLAKHLIETPTTRRNTNPARLCDCLQVALSVYTNVATTDNLNLDHDLLLSIGLLGRFLAWLREALLQQYPFFNFRFGQPSVKPADPKFQRMADGFGKVGVLEQQMVVNGWCPSVLDRNVTLSLESLYYFSHLPRPDPTKDHSTCLPAKCLAYQVDKDSYQQAHLSSCSGCDLVDTLSDDGTSAATVLEHNEIPVVTVIEVGQGKLRLQARAVTPNLNYVAVSHVWSDGLGNPFGNAMPSCQIREIRRLVQAMSPGEDANPFWIDTLCCPVSPKALRKSAIIKMAATYSGASSVLVLDKHLRSIAASRLSAFEKAFTILGSGWLGRLWTWQEGALSKSIHVQFSDGAVELEELFNEGLRFRTLLDQGWFCTLDMIQLYINIRGPQRGNPPRRTFRLEQFSFALRGRSTSVKEDEAICIGTMIGGSVPTILEEKDPKNYMRAFWSCYEEIPGDIIFWLNDNRIREPGYRWAPATFMEGKEQRFVLDEENQERSSNIAIRTPRGLRLACPYIMLTSSATFSSSDDIVKAMEDSTKYPLFSTFFVIIGGRKYAVSRWPGLPGTTFCTPHRLPSETYEYKGVALLLKKPLPLDVAPDTRETIPATVVYAYGDGGDGLYVRRGDAANINLNQRINEEVFGRYLGRIYVEQLGRGVKNNNIVLNGVMHATMGFVKDDHQMWCVD